MLKLIVVMFSLGSAALIWLILGRVRPEHRLLGTLAYLWNPVIVVELAGEGHNDAVMVFLVLLALALTVRHRAVSGIATMALGVLTKYLPLLLIPLQAVYLWRTRGSTREFTVQEITGAGVAAVLAVLLFTPFWVGLDTLDGIRMSGQVGNTGSTQTVVMGLLSLVIPPEVVRPLLFAVAVAGLVGYLGALAVSVTDARSLLLGCAWVSTAYLLLVSPTHWPWYAVLPVALLALTPQGSRSSCSWRCRSDLGWSPLWTWSSSISSSTGVCTFCSHGVPGWGSRSCCWPWPWPDGCAPPRGCPRGGDTSCACDVVRGA